MEAAGIGLLLAGSGIGGVIALLATVFVLTKIADLLSSLADLLVKAAIALLVLWIASVGLGLPYFSGRRRPKESECSPPFLQEGSIPCFHFLYHL